jgi:hypothetical protein
MTDTTAVPIGRIKLMGVRIAFAPGIFNASTVAGAAADATPKFNCGLIVGPDHPQLAEIIAKTIAVAKDKWKDKAAEIHKALKAQDRLALHDGDTKPSYDGYPGNFFLSPGNAKRPLVIDADKTPLTAADGRIYSGCMVNAHIDLWAMDNKYGKRINAELRGIQFAGDGAAFGAGGVANADEFESTEAATADDFA